MPDRTTGPRMTRPRVTSQADDQNFADTLAKMVRGGP